MNLHSLAAAFAFCLAAVPLNAQNDPLPEGTSPGQAAATPLPTAPPTQLIPSDLLPAPGTSPARVAPALTELDAAFSPPPLSPAAAEYKAHLEWRAIRNRIENDRTLKAARAKAERARTDLEKRKLLRRYYEMYYDKVMAMGSPEAKGYLTARKNEALAKLPQPRVRPDASSAAGPAPVAATGAISPAPSPSMSPTPSPTPGGLPSIFSSEQRPR